MPLLEAPMTVLTVLFTPTDFLQHYLICQAQAMACSTTVKNRREYMRGLDGSAVALSLAEDEEEDAGTEYGVEYP